MAVVSLCCKMGYLVTKQTQPPPPTLTLVFYRNDSFTVCIKTYVQFRGRSLTLKYTNAYTMISGTCCEVWCNLQPSTVSNPSPTQGYLPR